MPSGGGRAALSSRVRAGSIGSLPPPQSTLRSVPGYIPAAISTAQLLHTFAEPHVGTVAEQSCPVLLHLTLAGQASAASQFLMSDHNGRGNRILHRINSRARTRFSISKLTSAQLRRTNHQKRLEVDGATPHGATTRHLNPPSNQMPPRLFVPSLPEVAAVEKIFAASHQHLERDALPFTLAPALHIRT